MDNKTCQAMRDVFLGLSRDPVAFADVALEIAGRCLTYNFHPRHLRCDGALLALGLARIAIEVPGGIFLEYAFRDYDPFTGGFALEFDDESEDPPAPAAAVAEPPAPPQLPPAPNAAARGFTLLAPHNCTRV